MSNVRSDTKDDRYMTDEKDDRYVTDECSRCLPYRRLLCDSREGSLYTIPAAPDLTALHNARLTGQWMHCSIPRAIMLLR